jgi:translation initiation factor 1 (eIF-1/SUI1)
MSDKKDVVITFRLSKDEFRPFEKLLEKSNKTKSTFFREIFLSKQKNINITFNERKSIDYFTILRVINKSGNNINQIAKKLNYAAKNGIISEAIYLKGINLLININDNLKRHLNDR